MMKKWAALLAAALLCMAASAAFAAETLSIAVNGDETYTLENVVIEDDALQHAVRITGSGSLTLHLVGENRLAADMCGLYSEVPLTITGDGSLYAAAEGGGIWTQGSDLTILGGTIEGKGTGLASMGICANGGDIRISGGSITADGLTAGLLASDSLFIDGAQTRVTSQNTVQAGEHITISDNASVHAASSAYGFYAAGQLNLSSPNVEAYGNTAAVYAGDGIHCTSVVPMHRSSDSGEWVRCEDAAGCAAPRFKTAGILRITFDAGKGSGTMDAVTGAKGTALTITLPGCAFTPPANHRFRAWSVNGREMQPGEQLTVTEDTTVTALYKPDALTVSVVITPEAGGTVTGAGVYSYAAEATLTAVPAAGYRFTGWQLANEIVSTDAVYRFAVTEAVQITAVFDAAPVADVPGTGDDASLFAWCALALLSLCGMAALTRKKKEA